MFNPDKTSSRFRSVFSRRHVVLPVVHVKSEEQTLRNVRIAHHAGADGVFLINHGISGERLLSIHKTVRAAHPDWWVGVNRLGALSPADVFLSVDNSVSGVWVDSAMIDERSESQPHAQHVLEVQETTNWQGLYFGGVAFKYQRHVEDLAKAARNAAPYMDVVTTSGTGTGHAAHVEKIRVMKRALGEYPLAVASGITPDNVEDYLKIADCFLVATGISRSFHELDPDSVEELVHTVRTSN